MNKRLSFISIVIALLALSYQSALAQRINLNIRQRQDGGETVTIGNPRNNAQQDSPVQQHNAGNSINNDSQPPTSNAPAVQRPAPTQGEIQKAFRLIDINTRKVQREIDNLGRILERTNEQFRKDYLLISRLRSEDYASRPDMRQKSAWLFLRCGSLFPCQPQSVEICLAELAQIQSKDPDYLLYMLNWKILIGDSSGARATIAALQELEQADLADTIAVKGAFADRCGHKIDLTLRSTAGKVVSTTSGTASVIVLHKNSDKAKKTLALLRRICSDSRNIQLYDANFDSSSPNSPTALAAVNKLALPAAAAEKPCAIVLDSTGQLLYGGEINDWQLYRALDYAINTYNGITIYQLAQRQNLYTPETEQQTPPQAELAESGEDTEPQPAEKPSKPTAAQERQAKELHSAGWDKLRMGYKTNHPTFKKQGIELLRRCVSEYPGTEAAKQAEIDLKDAGESP